MSKVKRTLYILLPIIVLALILPLSAGCMPTDPCANPRIQYCIQQAKDAGYKDGYAKGKDEGYTDGKRDGDAAGYQRGLADGKGQCPQCPKCPDCPQYQYPYYTPYPYPYWYY